MLGCKIFTEVSEVQATLAKEIFGHDWFESLAHKPLCVGQQVSCLTGWRISHCDMQSKSPQSCELHTRQHQIHVIDSCILQGKTSQRLIPSLQSSMSNIGRDIQYDC